MTKKKLMMMVVVVAAAFGAWAETETVGGYTWTYRINGDTAVIFNNYSAAISPKPTGAVTIPSTLGGKPVTSIGSSAFYNCSGLTSVTIPDSVMSIGYEAFYGCSDSLYDTNSIPGVKLVDGWAVGNTGSLSGNFNLTGIRGVGSSAFSGCSGLASVTIPDSVTSIGSSAFSGCSGLASVTIPDSVTSIGGFAFEGCSGLTSVTIGNSVTSIGNNAFDGCSGLMSISVGAGNPNYRSVNGLLLTKDGKTLIQGVNGDVVIPNSVTDIGDRTFYKCSGLTSVTIPDSVTNIGSYAFYGCSGLTSVTIPDSVTSIGYDAFHNCSGLTSVTMPSSVTFLYAGEGPRGFVEAFEGCEKLWTKMYMTLANISAAGGTGGGSPSVVTTIVQQVESPYALTDSAADRAIAAVTVDSDCAIDSFVLKDGEVYDSVLYISNAAYNSVKLTLPSGFVYKTYKGTKPLEIPAKSQCMLSITRVADKTFLVSREELEDVQ